MLRVVKWYPDQVAGKWEAIGPAIESALPPIASGREDRLDKVLESILCGRLVVYAVVESDGESKAQLYGIMTVAIIDLVDGTEKSLLIYSLYGYRKVTLELVNEFLGLLKKIAVAEQCNSISAYSSVQPLIALCKSRGWNTDFTYIKLEV